MAKTIMAVGAHTGDAQLTCGMLLAKHAMAGDRVVICSDGLSSMVEDSQIEAIAVSSATAQAAVDNLGERGADIARDGGGEPLPHHGARDGIPRAAVRRPLLRRGGPGPGPGAGAEDRHPGGGACPGPGVPGCGRGGVPRGGHGRQSRPGMRRGCGGPGPCPVRFGYRHPLAG